MAGSGSVCLWGRMSSCARVANPRSFAPIDNRRAGYQPAPRAETDPLPNGRAVKIPDGPSECRYNQLVRKILWSLLGTVLVISSAPAQYPALPSETPAQFKPVTGSFDYIKRDVMIPMRDGVKLHTVILLPKGAKGAPILLTRTPYNATDLTSHAPSSHLGPMLQGYDNATDVIIEGGYIRVVEDVRGKHGSEGDYVMNRPLHGPHNPTPVDHSTDTYDTIDWLVKNIPEE